MKTRNDVHTAQSRTRVHDFILNRSGALLTKIVWRFFPRTVKGFPVLLAPNSKNTFYINTVETAPLQQRSL